MSYYYYGTNNTAINYESLDENSIRALQPLKIKRPLKDNQLTVLYAAQNMENNDRIPLSNNDGILNEWFNSQICIIADKVGAGKSLMVLSIIANKPQINYGIKTCSYTDRFNLYIDPHYNYIGINVLVVPHGIFKQWEGYIKNDTTLNCYFIQFKKHLQMNTTAYDSYEMVLISSTQYQTFANLFNDNDCISRLIFDEADSIKLPSCKEINACKYYFISASIFELRSCRISNNGFIKSVFYQMRDCPSKYFKNIVLKNTDDFIEKSFALQDPLKYIIRCKSPHSLNILTGIIGDDIIQMINAGDIGSIFHKYDMQITDDINVVKLICQNYFDELDNLKIKYEMKSKMKYHNAEGKKNALLNIQIHIKEIENKIKCIEERIQQTDVCGICLDDFTNRSLTPCCRNVFCFECLSMTLAQRAKCPMCNSPITQLKDIIILDNEGSYHHVSENCVDKSEELDKIDNFKKIVEQLNLNGRLLVFSEYDASFNQMLEILDNHGIKYSKIMGTSTHINSTVNKYKTGEIQCLLLNARYFGSGLNLENTTDIIIYHKMKDNLKKQVIGRAQRPGRTCQLKIWEFCYDNELV